MTEKYKVVVDDNFEFEISSTEIQELDVLELPNNKSHLLYKQQSFLIESLENDFIHRKYAIKVNGNTYTISVGTSLDQLIEEMGLSLGNDSVEDMIYAPMPGIILEVNVAEGDEVKQGDFLCVLEAMKMENALTSPRDAVIKAVNIVKGETVDKGKLLIEFKEND